MGDKKDTEPVDFLDRKAPEDTRTIVLTFHEDGNINLQATPSVNQGDYIHGSWLLSRVANSIADAAQAQQAQRGLYVPDSARPLGGITKLPGRRS